MTNVQSSHLPTDQELRRDYARGYKACLEGTELEPKWSLDAFDAGYSDAERGERRNAARFIADHHGAL